MSAGLSPPPTPETPAPPRVVEESGWLSTAWYESIRAIALTWFSISGGLRAYGMENLPPEGGVLMVANHLSFLDVFVLGIPLKRRLNYVARSTLFKPILGTLIRSVGGFPIQIEGRGAGGLKETLKRLKEGKVVAMFPEGSRSYDGRMIPLKPGIAVLASRAHVPIVPAAVAGTFEGWPRTKLLPGCHAIRIVYGPAIPAEELAGLDHQGITSLLYERIAACHREALIALGRDLGIDPGQFAPAARRRPGQSEPPE